MSSSYIVTTPVSSEPIALSDAKAYMRIDFSDDDALISNLIARVRSYAEGVTHRSLATQTIQQVDLIERPVGGELSGPLKPGVEWYEFNQALGANPFGPAQFFFSLSAPPIQGDASTITVETKVIVFDPWVTFPYTTNSDGSTNMYLDSNREPARLYLQTPITANMYRFTYSAGYNSSRPMPPGLMQALFEMTNFFYDNREAQDLPQPLINKLLQYRVDWI